MAEIARYGPFASDALPALAALAQDGDQRITEQARYTAGVVRRALAALDNK
jgi:hypothetical protein